MEISALKYKVRPGTLDSGKEYEFKMAALLSLRCLRQDVGDFWMASNAEGVGAFDDLILQIKTTTHENLTYMLQLKHQDKPRNILEKEFLQPKGDFSLSKYFKDIDKLYNSIHTESGKETLVNNLGKFTDVHFVLFTNRSVNTCNFLEECSDASLSFIQTGNIATNTLYKFNIVQMQHLQILEEDKYSNIYLLPNQVSAKHIDKEIEEELVKVGAGLGLRFADTRNVLDRYIKYITDWAKGSLGGHYGITRKDVLCKVAELLLSPYQIELGQQRFSNHREIQNTWNEIIRDHNAIIIDSNEDPVVKFIFQCVYDEIKDFSCGNTTNIFSIEEQNRFYQEHLSLKASMLKTVGNTGKITIMDLYKCLWINNKCPVLLKITNTWDYECIVHILNILRFKAIIFNCSQENLSFCPAYIKQLRSLQDMDENQRKKILLQDVRLQGRAYAKLENLVDETMYEYISCRDIIHILLDSFDIGPTLQPLPPYFIARSVRRLFLLPEVLKEVTSEIFLVSNYSEKHCKILPVENAEVCRLEDVDCLKGTSIRIITIHQNCDLEAVNMRNYKEGTIHHVAIYDKHHLEWKWSSGSTNNIRPFLLNLEKYDDNIEQYFNNPTNIISEVAGMGKSILMDFIAQEAPIDKWVLRIDLNKHQRYYRSQYCKQSRTSACKHLNYFHQALLGEHQTNTKLTEMIFQKFVHSKNIIVLLDGFDEVSVSYKDAVTNIVISLHREEYQVWLTTRPHMKSYLEKEFGTFSISLKPFSLDDQEQFLVKYFTACNLSLVSEPGAVVRNFCKKLLDASRKNLLDKDAKFTGIPLQTQLLADFFSEKFKEHLTSGIAVDFSQHFDLLGLYQNFIDNKFDILCERFGEAAVDAHTLFREHQALFALQLVFRMDNYAGMTIYRKLNEYYSNGANKIHVLQRDGVIMVDEEQNVTCIHRTFAEYLAANWLSNNVNSDDSDIKEFSHYLIQQRFSESHQFLFSIFDRLLARGFPLHMAIINGQADDARHIISSDPSATVALDRGGRSVSHMLALYGLQFPLAYKAAKVSDLQENDFTQDLVNYVADCNNADLIGYTPLDYALSNRSLIIANKLYEKTKNCRINAYVNLNYKSDYLKYCIALKFMSLFKALLQSFIFKDLLLKEIGVNTTMEQYLHITICYPHYHKSNPIVSHFISEFKDMSVLKYVTNYSNFSSDFRYVICFGANQNLTNFPLRTKDINQMDMDQNTLLHYAVLHCKPKWVEKLLANNAVVDAQNKHGNTPLHLAFIMYNKTNIKLLLDKGANVNIANKNGETALHLTTHVYDRGILSKVQFFGNRVENMSGLFSKGATVNTTNNEGETPLYVAVKNNNQIALAKLVKYGADINHQDYGGNTPLHLALLESHFDIAAKLVRYGADVNIKNKKGFTALHYATEKKCSAMVHKLLSRGADINVQNKFGVTPLHLAFKESSAEIIKILIEHGAKLNVENDNGETVLHYATGKCHHKITRILLLKGIDVNKQNNYGNTPLHMTLNKEVYLVDMDIVKLLLAHGADLNKTNRNGETVLHIAAKYGNSYAVNELLSHGAEVNRQDWDGHTPLHTALKVKKMGNIKVRISDYRSIDISNTETGPHLYNAANKCNYIVAKLLEEQDSGNPNTQLYLASMRGHIESSRILICNGADVNIGSKKGKTALHYAAENFYNDILLDLLAKGAEVNQQDASGDTPLHLAFRKGHKSTAELLISNKADVDIMNSRGFTAHRYVIHNSLRSALYPENGKAPRLYVKDLIRTSKPAYRLEKMLMS